MERRQYYKIIGILGIWLLLGFILKDLEMRFKVSLSFINISILPLLFYGYGKKQNISFNFLKCNKQLLTRIPEVISGKGWIELIRILIGLALILIFLIIGFDPDTTTINTNKSILTMSFFIGILLKDCIMIPILEEFIFRGVLFELTKMAPRTKAILFNIVLFGILHLSLSGILQATLMGFVAFELREKNNDIYSGILLHMLTNIIATISFLFNSTSDFFVILLLPCSLYYLFNLVKTRKHCSLNKDYERYLSVKK